MRRSALVLAIALAACAFTPPNTLPPVPASVTTVLGESRVTFTDTMPIVVGRGAAMARFDELERDIYLASPLQKNRAAAWQALEHERCHVTLFDAGLYHLFTDPAARPILEAVCDAFATEIIRRKIAGRP
jgi:hypothetical protein